jgi:hypothetical protein
MVCLIVLGLSTAAPAAPRTEADQLTPSDAEMVVTVNVRQMLKTPVVQKHALDPLKLVLQRSRELQRLLTAAGIDPLKDIDTIGLSTSGNPGVKGKLQAVLRGNFDPDKVRTAAEDYARKYPGQLKTLKEGSRSLWQITSDNRAYFAAFAGKGTLVLTASKNDTLAAVQRAGQPPQRLNKNLQAAVDQIPGGESLWLAMVATDSMKQVLKGDDTAKNFADALQSITGSLELTDDAQLALDIHTSNPAAATQIKGKLDEVMPLLQFLGAGKETSGRIVKEVIDSIKLGTDKNDVNIRLKLTDAQIDKVRKKDS